MRKFYLLFLSAFLIASMSSFNSSESMEDGETCWVTLIYSDPDTGESYSETYYSTSRTSDSDCAAGAEALANGDLMGTSDFKRSPVLAP